MWLSLNNVFAQNLVQADVKTMAQLRRFRFGYTTSMVNKKPEALATYYADDVRLMPEFQKP